MKEGCEGQMEEERNKEKERKDEAKYSLDNGKQTHTQYTQHIHRGKEYMIYTKYSLDNELIVAFIDTKQKK